MLVSVLLEIVLILTQDRCMVCVERAIGWKITRWKSQVMWIMWNLAYFRLEAVLVSVQDRCMVGARCTIGSEIILDTLIGTTR
jgi:hypothetical protein